MEKKLLRIDEINPYENNPRVNIDAIPEVMESIRQVGYNTPIVVDENYVILSGHTRYAALVNLGYTEIECIVQTDMDEQQKKKYRVLDNKTAEEAEWDDELLSGELDGLDLGGINWFDDIVNDNITDLNEKKSVESQCRCPRCGAIAEVLEVY